MRENSPTGDSKSDGVVERAIQSVEGMVRVLKLALEMRLQVKMPTKHPIIPWLVEYASFLLSPFEVSSDGKLPSRGVREKGRKCSSSSERRFYGSPVGVFGLCR